MPSTTRSNDKREPVSQSPAGLDQHCSTCGSVPQRDLVELTRPVREAKLSAISKKEGEESQINIEREGDGKRKVKKGNKTKVKAEHDKPEATYEPTEEHSDGNLKELSAEKEQPTMQKVMVLQRILGNWKHTVENYKESIAATSFTLDMIDDQSLSSLSPCMADIRKANDSLKKEMELKFANLESPASTTEVKTDLHASTKVEKVQEVKMAQNEKQVMMSGPKTFPIDFREYDDNQAAASRTTPKGGKYLITSITELRDGKMVISGTAPDQQLHITVINSKGKIERKHQIKRGANANIDFRCCHMLENEVATVYGKQEIAIYDALEGKQCKSYPEQIKWKTSCVAYDPIDEQIFVCYGHAKVLSKLGNELNHIGTTYLPKKEEIGFVNDIAVHQDFLLVCHQKGARAIDKKKLQLQFELEHPPGKTHAIGVCIDKNSFIYILWSNDKICSLTQYSKDGKYLLNEELEQHVKKGCLTTLDVAGGECLVIAGSGNLYSFQLKAKE